MKVWVVVPSGSVEREVHNLHIVSYSNSCDKTLSKVQNVLSFAMENGVYPPIITEIGFFGIKECPPGFEYGHRHEPFQCLA